MVLNFGRMQALAAALTLLSLANLACRSEHTAKHKTKVEWRSVGSWSGHGDAQTDSFDIGYTDVRIRWETKNENPAGAGTLRVAVCSAVSGRELTVAVNSKGVGHNVAYVTVDPHWSYLLINSNDLDWSVSVEEPSIVDAP